MLFVFVIMKQIIFVISKVVIFMERTFFTMFLLKSWRNLMRLF